MNSKSTNELISQLSKDIGIGTIFTVVGAYAIFVSVLYCLGYWSIFKFNAFEYIGPSDLLTHAIFVVVPMVGVVMWFGAVSYWMGQYIAKFADRCAQGEQYSFLKYLISAVILLLPVIIVGGGFNRPINWFTWGMAGFAFLLFLSAVPVMRYMNHVSPKHTNPVSSELFILLYFLVGIILLGGEIFTIPNSRYLWIYLLGFIVFAVIIMIVVDELKYFGTLPKREAVFYRFVLTLLVLFPAAALTLGRVFAERAQRGDSYLFVASGSQLPVDLHQKTVSYLGRLGDFFVLYEKASGRLFILKTDKLKSLMLVPAGQDLTKK